VLPARPLRLKGFDRPLRVNEVVREPESDEEPSRGRPGRRWTLLALAAVLLAGAVAAAVVLLRGNDNAAATGHHAQGGGGGLVSKADDPATIVMGTSIGPVALGTSKDAVRAKLGAPESTTDWGPAKGKSGDNAFYFPNDHRLRISYYNDEVVQITTYDSYYKTPQGVGVGVTFPTPPGLNQSPPPGLSPIGPGCYEWRGIVNGLGVADWYVTGNDAVTRFDTPISAAGGYRIVDVTMTKKEFFEPLIESETGGNYKIKLSDLRC
jgi:hypothetical protein